MNQIIFTKARLPFLIVLICCIEACVYLWSAWTSRLQSDNFFAIEPEFIFDKSARIAGRISTAIILFVLLLVGKYGLTQIYSIEQLKDRFRILLTLFSVNHLIHLLFVLLLFEAHNKPILVHGPIQIGGMEHGLATFLWIVLIPFILWYFQKLTKPLYFTLLFHLFNISLFISKTFLGKVKPPEQPAYHNQLGIAIISLACAYVLYKEAKTYRFQ